MNSKNMWRWKRSPLPWAMVVLGVVVVLVGARLAMPSLLKYYANKQLNKSKDYSGKIGDVTVHLWRGAYQIHGIDIFKKTGKVPVPFFSTHTLDLSLQWSELIHGKFVSKIYMFEPKVNFVSGPTKEQSQTGTENHWDKMLESLVPFKINSLMITNGQVHFKNPYSNPPVDIYISELSGMATNFTNSREIKQELPAGVTATGRTLGKGEFDLQVHMNPMAKVPTFEMTGQLTNVDLVELNNFLRAYGKFDVARGDFALFTSFAAKDGKYDGYAKVLFKDLDVFEWQKEGKKNALEVFWQAIVGAVTTAFKNQPHDQLATRIPITGTFQKSDVSTWPTIQTLLRNAFVRALVPSIDEPKKLENAEQVQPPGK